MMKWIPRSVSLKQKHDGFMRRLHAFRRRRFEDVAAGLRRMSV